jgi:hypothetical protein
MIQENDPSSVTRPWDEQIETSAQLQPSLKTLCLAPSSRGVSLLPVGDIVVILATALAQTVPAVGEDVESIRVVSTGATIDEIPTPRILEGILQIRAPPCLRNTGWPRYQSAQTLRS